MTRATSRGWAAGVVAAALLVLAIDATADSRSDARLHFERGAALFRAGRFAAARARFQAAYEAMPDPRVLADVAACYAAEGRPADALRTYRRVLTHQGPELSPAARRRVRAEIDALSAHATPAEAVTSEPPPAGPATAPEPGPPIGRGPLLWTGVGLGAALAVAGTVTGILALDRSAQVNDPDRGLDERRRLREQTGTLSATTDALLDAALLVGLATIVLYALGGPRDASSPDDAAQHVASHSLGAGRSWLHVSEF